MDKSSITVDDAMRLHAKGRRQEARAAYEAILQRDPENHRAANSLGRLFGELGDHASAIPLLRHAVVQAPAEVPYRFHLGQTLFACQRFEAAEEIFRGAITMDPQNGRLMIWLANVLMATGRAREAETSYELGIELLPADRRTLMYFGDQLRNLGHHQPALAIYRRWAGLFPNEPAAYSRIASVHYKLRDWDNAETACLQAARLSPNEAFFHAQLAEIYERTNRIEAAREMASRAIELNGDLPLANLTLAKIERRQQEYEASKARLTRLVESGLLSQRLLASAHLELGHVHEALGEFDEAFDCFQAGKSVCAKSPEARSMSRETYPALLDGYRQQITSENVGKWSDVALDNRSPPVFLVGFPRSGTTLLEQILGRHPQMIAVDEPPFVSKMLTAAQVLAGPSLSYPKVLNLLNENQIRGLAIEYWDAVKERFDAKDLSGKTLLDKLPLNLNHLPLIRRVFPNAHVIVAVRDPRDCVLSFFFQQFRPNIAMIHSHTLDDSARLYEKVMGLWLHYRACLGLNWIESRYEDLVDDAATSVRRLFEFLGIGWDSSVLSIPEEQQGKVSSTPSYQMVIRPVYKSAVGRWRLYSKHLEGVMPRLQPFVDEFRYD